MITIDFRPWLENLEAKRTGVKDVILNFLKSKLHIDDDQEILSMPLGSIDKKVIGDLLARGIISTADEGIAQDVKNGSITVMELVNRLSGWQGKSMDLPHKTSHFSSSQGIENAV